MPLFSFPKEGKVDWTLVHNLDLDALVRNEREEDVVQLEDLYETLIRVLSNFLLFVDPRNGSKGELLKLFRAVQLLLELKGGDNKQLEEELIELENQVAKLKGGTVQPSTSSSTGGPAREELVALKNQYEHLQLELKFRNEELEGCKAEIAQVHKDTAQREAQILQLQKDLEISELTVKDYQKQTKAHSTLSTLRMDDDVRGELRAKQRELTNCVNKMEELMAENKSLKDTVSALSQNLKESVASVEEATGRAASLERAVFESEKQNEALEHDKALLQSRVEDLLQKLELQGEDEKQALIGVHETIDALKHSLAVKEAELNLGQQVVNALKRDLVTSQGALAKANETISSKEKEITALQAKLNEAAQSLDNAANTKRRNSIMHIDRANLNAEPQVLESKIQDLKKEKEGLLSELQKKDRQITELSKELDDYEKGVYGLHDAVRDIKGLKAQLAIRENDLLELTKQINVLSRDVSDVDYENELLRDRLGLEKRTEKDREAVTKKRNVELEQLRSVNRLLSKDIERLEAERTELKQRLVLQAMERGQRAVEIGFTTGDLELAEEHADIESKRRQRSGSMYHPSEHEGKGEGMPPQRKAGLVQGEDEDENGAVRVFSQRGRTKSISRLSGGSHGDTVPMPLFIELQTQLSESQKELDAVKRDRGSLQQKNVSLTSENQRLGAQLEEEMASNLMFRNTISELSGAIAEVQSRHRPSSPEAAVVSISCPSVLRLVEHLERGSLLAPMVHPSPLKRDPARDDKQQALQPQVGATKQISASQYGEVVSRLQGANEELRSALAAAQLAREEAVQEGERQKMRVARVEEQLLQIKNAHSASESLRGLSLPSSMPPSSADVIACLNEHLLHVLQELSLRDASVSKISEELKHANHQYGVLKHQLSILYDEYAQKKSDFEAETKRFEHQLAGKNDVIEELNVVKADYDQLTATLTSNNEETMQSRLADAMRRATALKLSQSTLSRKLMIATQSEERFEKENTKLKDIVATMNATVQTRVAYLEQYREAASFQIASLQDTLAHCVREDEFLSLQKQYEGLSGRYRVLVERETGSVDLGVSVEMLSFQNTQLKNENEVLLKKIQHCEEENKKLSSSLAAVKDKVSSSFVSPSDSAVAMTVKMETVQLQALNEKQRADLLFLECAQSKEFVDKLRARNVELEAKFAKLTESFLATQANEQELKDKIASCITMDQYESLREENGNMSRQLKVAQDEMASLKSMAAIATQQVEAMHYQRTSQEEAVSLLKREVRELMAGSDAAMRIGDVHNEIVAKQLGEAELLHKNHVLTVQTQSMQASILRLQQQCDAKDEAMGKIREDARVKVAYLRKSLQLVRVQYAGSVPLAQQEKLREVLRQVSDRKAELEREVSRAAHTRKELEDKLLSHDLTHNALQELITTLKGGHAAERAIEWHSKVTDLRLTAMKLTREVALEKEHSVHLQSVIDSREVLLRSFDEEMVSLRREFEAKSMKWEERELFLENALEESERERSKLTRKDTDLILKLHQDGLLPDPSLSVAKQLEEALATIMTLSPLLKDLETENKYYKGTKDDFHFIRKELEAKILQRDVQINELKILLRDAGLVGVLDTDDEEAMSIRHHHEEAIRVAKETIASLQEIVSQKEEAINAMRSIVDSVHLENQKTKEECEQRVKELLDKIQHLESREMGETIVREKVVLGPPPKGVDALMAQISDLTLAKETHEIELALAGRKLSAALAQIVSLQSEIEGEKAHRERHVGSLLQEKDSESLLHKNKIESLQEQVVEKDTLITSLKEEVAQLREISSASVKNTLDKLRRQAEEKEKQVKSLQGMVSQLRKDLVEVAEHAVSSRSRGHDDEEGEDIGGKVSKLEERCAAMLAQMQNLETALQKEKQKAVLLEDQKTKLEVLVAERDKSLREKEGGVSKMAETLSSTKAAHQQSLKKCKAMEEELATLKTKLTSSESEVKADPSEAFQKWDLDKKYQKKVSTLQEKLDSKTQECADLAAQLEGSKGTITRLDKERMLLHQKLKILQKEVPRHAVEVEPDCVSSMAPSDNLAGNKDGGTKSLLTPQPPPPHSSSSSSSQKGGVSTNKGLSRLTSTSKPGSKPIPSSQCDTCAERARELFEAKTKIFALEEETTRLRQIIEVEDAATIKELRHRLDSSESLQKDGSSSQQEEASRSFALEKENLDLRFEIETKMAALPRLRARVAELTTYVESLLKYPLEPEAIQGEDKSIAELLLKISSLSRTVSLLQEENKALKKNEGTSSKLNEANAEIKKLTQELKGEKKKVAELPTIAILTEANTKLIAEVERLKHALKKEVDLHAKMASKVDELSRTNVSLSKELDSLKKKSSQLAEQRGVLPQNEAKKFESEIASLKAELQTKSTKIDELGTLLKSSVLAESSLRKQLEEIENSAPNKAQPLVSNPPDLANQQHQEYLAKQSVEQSRELKAALLKIREHEKRSVLLEKENHQLKEDFKKAEKAFLGLQQKVSEVARENEELKGELAAFDPAFFEEIEDLKFKYQEALQRNILLEKKLSASSSIPEKQISH